MRNLIAVLSLVLAYPLAYADDSYVSTQSSSAETESRQSVGGGETANAEDETGSTESAAGGDSVQPEDDPAGEDSAAAERELDV